LEFAKLQRKLDQSENTIEELRLKLECERKEREKAEQELEQLRVRLRLLSTPKEEPAIEESIVATPAVEQSNQRTENIETENMESMGSISAKDKFIATPFGANRPGHESEESNDLQHPILGQNSAIVKSEVPDSALNDCMAEASNTYQAGQATEEPNTDVEESDSNQMQMQGDGQAINKRTREETNGQHQSTIKRIKIEEGMDEEEKEVYAPESTTTVAVTPAVGEHRTKNESETDALQNEQSTSSQSLFEPIKIKQEP